jgi:hypothetical protein
MLVSLEHLMDGFNVTSMITMIMSNSCISNPNFIFTKLMSFSANGVSVFQGYRIGVAIQL